jgi:hypothetical protein
MTQAAIRSTATQRVRAFLAGQGVALAPWSGLDETYVASYALSSRRGDDPAGWSPVTGLLEEIVGDVTDPGSPETVARAIEEMPDCLCTIRSDLLAGDCQDPLPSAGTLCGAIYEGVVFRLA